MTYIHEDVIRAWVDGKTVQVQSPDGKWYPLPPLDAQLMVTPAFAADCRYRVKPVDDPFPALIKTFGSQCGCRTSCDIGPHVPVLTDTKPLEQSDVKLVQDIVAGIEAHKLSDNERGL